jgi:hypothetical protein
MNFFFLSLSFLSLRIKFHFSPCKKSNELTFLCWFMFVLILVLVFLLQFILLLMPFEVILFLISFLIILSFDFGI